jgi:hypothetical protein
MFCTSHEKRLGRKLASYLKSWVAAFDQCSSRDVILFSSPSDFCAGLGAQLGKDWLTGDDWVVASGSAEGLASVAARASAATLVSRSPPNGAAAAASNLAASPLLAT